MTYHNHKPQTDPRHRGEETQNTESHNTIRSVFLSTMTAKLERAQRSTPHNEDTTETQHTINKQ